ncbi:MAG: hypothetical protein WBV28_11940 [Terracidiphilus sp.]
MKRNMTLALAASFLTLTLSAFPHRAAADSNTALPLPSPAASSGKHIKEVKIELQSILLVLRLL